MKMKKRLIGFLMCVMLLVSLIPVTAFANGRTVVSTVEISSSTGDITPEYGDTVERPTFTVTTGSPAYVNNGAGNGNWQKYNESTSSWQIYPAGLRFTEGTYRYYAQVRIDNSDGHNSGDTHKLDANGVTVTVDGNAWSTDYLTVQSNYSYVAIMSPGFDVTLGAGQQPVEKINKVSASIEAPVAGENLSIDMETDSTDYEAHVLDWGVADSPADSALDIGDPENHTVQDGKIYYLTVRFECTNNNKFFDCYNMKVDINGMSDPYWYHTDDGDIIVEKVFMEVPEDEIVTIKMKTNNSMADFSDEQIEAFEILNDCAMLQYDNMTNAFADACGKQLFKVDSSGYIELEDGVNEEDNIKFVLFPEDSEYYYNNSQTGVYISEIRVEFVPNEVASDVILIEIENGKSVTALSDKQELGMEILEDEGLIVWSAEHYGFVNQAGKLLYTANDAMEAVLGEDVTAADNISFVLPQDLRDDLYDFYGLNIAEVRMNFIVDEPTYKVSFVANGGTGTMADVTDVSGEYTLPANGFTAPSGKQFKAWSVNGVEKAVGDKITVTADTVVTAVWEATGGSGVATPDNTTPDNTTPDISDPDAGVSNMMYLLIALLLASGIVTAVTVYGKRCVVK